MTTVNPIDYFQTESTAIDLKYDFNNDGNVDIADYHYLELLNNDDDTTNDNYKITDTEIQTVFASILKKDEENNQYTNLNTNNVNSFVENSLGKIANPNDAKNLKELQNIGASLTQYIKNCSKSAGLLSTVISTTTKELKELKPKQEAAELKYTQIAARVEAKAKEIAKQTQKIIEESISMSNDYKTACEKTVQDCIYKYIHGDYYGKNLEDVIQQSLYTQKYDTTPLANAQKQNSYEGLMLSKMCDSLSSLTESIRTINYEYNSKNALLKTSVANRNTVIANGNTASANYAKGYTVRTNLRNSLIEQYHTASGGDINSSENAQVQSLSKFLDNGELNNMTFEDAWVVLQGAFDGCGLEFDDDKKTISIPIGHDTASSNVFNLLQESLIANFGNETVNAYKSSGYSDGNGTTATTGTVTSEIVNRTDPINFNSGNFSYNFIQDKNNDGIFNDKTEFLGAENGWAELVAYDTNNDGQINNDELKNMTVLKMNKENGQFTFQNAFEAGISNIDLNSYKEKNELSETLDLINGTFTLTFNGEQIEGTRSEDLFINLDNNFRMVYSSQITDLSDDYAADKNPFLTHVDIVNAEKTSSDTKRDIFAANITSEEILSSAENEVKSKASTTNVFAQENKNEDNKEIQETTTQTKKTKIS